MTSRADDGRPGPRVDELGLQPEPGGPPAVLADDHQPALVQARVVVRPAGQVDHQALDQGRQAEHRGQVGRHVAHADLDRPVAGAGPHVPPELLGGLDQPGGGQAVDQPHVVVPAAQPRRAGRRWGRPPSPRPGASAGRWPARTRTGCWPTGPAGRAGAPRSGCRPGRPCPRPRRRRGRAGRRSTGGRASPGTGRPARGSGAWGRPAGRASARTGGCRPRRGGPRGCRRSARSAASLRTRSRSTSATSRQTPVLISTQQS